MQEMFEQAVQDGLFTDYDVSVRGLMVSDFQGGRHVSRGSQFFDISSLTKALTYLLMWRMFSEGIFSPDDDIGKFLSIPNVCGRQLWHLMSYLVQGYWFDKIQYQHLRSGCLKPFKETMLARGFGLWKKEFHYDNFASALVGFLLESHFEGNIEGILHEQLSCTEIERKRLLFHPVFRGLIQKDMVVPTGADSVRGFVHDPLSFAHQSENIVAAGLFSDARTITEIFQRTIDPIIHSGFFDIGSRNQLERVGIVDYDYALGFDRPYKESLGSYMVDNPLMFAGWTGCRILFAKRPRVTICILTNRVFCEDSEESRKRFSQFFWSVVREVLRRVS